MSGAKLFAHPGIRQKLLKRKDLQDEVRQTERADEARSDEVTMTK
jgi:hypothetical protein